MTSDSELDELIEKRIKIASTETKSDDRVVQIAWLADGINVWYQTNGERGNSPAEARRFIISSISRLLAEVADNDVAQGGSANASPSRELAPEAQSEAPSVDTIIDRLILEYGDHIEADDELSDWHIEKPIIFQRKLVEAKAKINRLTTEARIDELKKIGPWDEVIENRIKELESTLSNNLSKGDGNGQAED